MRVIANKVTDTFEKPGGARTGEMVGGEAATATGRREGSFTEIDFGDGSPKVWVLTADLDAQGVPAPASVDEERFVEDCITVERIINEVPATAPWLISADFLIARALIETDLKSAGPKIPGSDAAGPLQVSSAEWKDFLDNAGALARGFLPKQYDQPLAQIRGAGFRMHRNAKAISDLQVQNGVGTPNDPFLPSLLDVFHAYILDSAPAAVAVIKASASETDMTKRLDEVLRGVLDAAKLAALFAARSRFTGEAGAPKKVAEFVAGTEKALTEALARALQLMQQHAPEELLQVKQGEAPWMEAAIAAETAGVDEHKPEFKDTILNYFAATSLGRQSRILPWCGAFAAHCMKSSGNAALIPDAAARAASWQTFGVGLPVNPGEVPVGAIVVMSPGKGTGTSGHVGFFTQFLNNNANVELLGGNQSDKVKRTSFRTANIAAIRWVEAGTPPAAEIQNVEPSPPAPAGGKLISDDAVRLLIEFEVSSQKAYERRYRHPVWPGGASGLTIGIGYDVGHQNVAQLRSDCTGILNAAMITTLEGACGRTGPAGKAITQQLKAGVDVPWDEAEKLFIAKSIPRWVGLVKRSLPNTEALGPDSLGALVSLTYNRGASFKKDGSRFTEMRAIRQHMEDRAFTKIPGEIRKMKRLWPGVRGLLDRRDREADLFERGIAGRSGQATTAPTTTIQGDVRAADVVEAVPRPMDVRSFVKRCTHVARIIKETSATQGVSRDYLIALALVLNEVQSLPLSDAQLTGFSPYRLTEREWERFLNQGDNKARYFPKDRRDPLAQIDAAAFFALEAAQALTEALTDLGQDKGSGPYVPSPIALFAVHMIGAQAAIAAVKKVRGTANKGADTSLADLVKESGGNPDFLGSASTMTISAALEFVEQKFDAAYKLAASLVAEYTPEDLPGVGGRS
jgi:uncharacterized protein (TIGR02594 family)